MNIVISKKTDAYFVENKQYEIGEIKGNMFGVKSEKGITWVNIEDTDFVFIFNADKRVVILPCELGSKVFKLSYQHCCTCPELDYFDVKEVKFEIGMVNEWGKWIFGTREEAEERKGKLKKWEYKEDD